MILDRDFARDLGQILYGSGCICTILKNSEILTKMFFKRKKSLKKKTISKHIKTVLLQRFQQKLTLWGSRVSCSLYKDITVYKFKIEPKNRV